MPFDFDAAIARVQSAATVTEWLPPTSMPCVTIAEANAEVAAMIADSHEFGGLVHPPTAADKLADNDAAGLRRGVKITTPA